MLSETRSQVEDLKLEKNALQEKLAEQIEENKKLRSQFQNREETVQKEETES
jgi:hypothetical protein